VCGIALAIMTVVSLALGWLMAGRVLRPLRTITAATLHISAHNLHELLALAGPDDEVRELGDMVDGLLGRLEAAFAAQRQFVANASHELRTPLARQRTLLEVALADPAPDVGGLLTTCERVLNAGLQQERLIEALLTLARSERGLEHREPVDLCRPTLRVANSGPVVPARWWTSRSRRTDRAPMNIIRPDDVHECPVDGVWRMPLINTFRAQRSRSPGESRAARSEVIIG
jgi:signal transduction histidine kinase